MDSGTCFDAIKETYLHYTDACIRCIFIYTHTFIFVCIHVSSCSAARIKKSSTLVSFELIIVHDHFIHFVFCQLSLMRAPWCIFLLLYHVWPWLFSGFKTSSYNLMIPRNYAAHDIMFNWGILQNTMAQLFSAEDTVLHHLQCVSTLQCVRYSVQIDGILFPYEYTWNLFICI